MEVLKRGVPTRPSKRGCARSVTFKQIEEQGVEKLLKTLSQELQEQNYRALPCRKVSIPKEGGKVRGLKIPAIRDRVVQGAVRLVMEPIFEADFEPGSFAYRPRRSVPICEPTETQRSGRDTEGGRRGATRKYTDNGGPSRDYKVRWSKTEPTGGRETARCKNSVGNAGWVNLRVRCEGREVETG